MSAIENEQAARRAYAPVEQMGPYKLLLVEDSPSDARLVIEMLHDVEAARFDLARATRLDEALRRIAKGGIDCVLLDILLPDSMGLDTFRRLKESAPGIPIIILSGLSDDEVGDTLLAEGAQAHLVKGTFEPRRLERTILQAIRAGQQVEEDQASADHTPLRIGRELLMRIVDNLPDAVLLMDDGDAVRFVNAVGADDLGVESGDLLPSLASVIRGIEAADDEPAADLVTWSPASGRGEFEVRPKRIRMNKELFHLVVLREL